MKKEHTVKPISGYWMLLVDLALLAAGLYGLVVVLCGDRDATPVINTGTLNQ